MKYASYSDDGDGHDDDIDDDNIDGGYYENFLLWTFMIIIMVINKIIMAMMYVTFPLYMMQSGEVREGSGGVRGCSVHLASCQGPW